MRRNPNINLVAPLRGRGLKQDFVDRIEEQYGRSLTGAWIETAVGEMFLGFMQVAPLRGRGLKHRPAADGDQKPLSLPYGGVD